MKPPTSPFQLGRMRWLDLLALYFQLNPAGRGDNGQWAARLSHGNLVRAVLSSAPHP